MNKVLAQEHSRRLWEKSVNAYSVAPLPPPPPPSSSEDGQFPPSRLRPRHKATATTAAEERPVDHGRKGKKSSDELLREGVTDVGSSNSIRGNIEDFTLSSSKHLTVRDGVMVAGRVGDLQDPHPSVSVNAVKKVSPTTPLVSNDHRQERDHDQKRAVGRKPSDSTRLSSIERHLVTADERAGPLPQIATRTSVTTNIASSADFPEDSQRQAEHESPTARIDSFPPIATAGALAVELKKQGRGERTFASNMRAVSGARIVKKGSIVLQKPLQTQDNNRSVAAPNKVLMEENPKQSIGGDLKIRRKTAPQPKHKPSDTVSSSILPVNSKDSGDCADEIEALNGYINDGSSVDSDLSLFDHIDGQHSVSDVSEVKTKIKPTIRLGINPTKEALASESRKSRKVTRSANTQSRKKMTRKAQSATALLNAFTQPSAIDTVNMEE